MNRLNRLTRVASLALAIFAGSTFVRADDAVRIAAGEGKFTFVDEKGYPDKPIPVWTYAPEGLQPDSPIVFVMHGTKRNADVYLRNWKPEADKYKFLLIVPEFSAELYPPAMYQRGNLFDRADKPVESEKWVYASIERLFDRVKELSGNTRERYNIYGHSAGGQFVHRFCLFMPDARYDRAIAANPGWYTLPSFSTDYPYGLQKTQATEASLKKVLGRNVSLLLGDQDTNRDDPDLHKSPQADEQGLVRFDRGQFFFKQLFDEAKRLDTPLEWKLRVVPGVGHSDRLMAPAAATVFFDRDMPQPPDHRN